MHKPCLFCSSDKALMDENQYGLSTIFQMWIGPRSGKFLRVWGYSEKSGRAAPKVRLSVSKSIFSGRPVTYPRVGSHELSNNCISCVVCAVAYVDENLAEMFPNRCSINDDWRLGNRMSQHPKLKSAILELTHLQRYRFRCLLRWGSIWWRSTSGIVCQVGNETAILVNVGLQRIYVAITAKQHSNVRRDYLQGPYMVEAPSYLCTPYSSRVAM